MPNSNIKDLLNTIAKAADHVSSKDVDISSVCPHCGGPLEEEQPESSPDQPESSEDK